MARILASWNLTFLGPGIIAKSVATPSPVARTEAFLAVKADIAFLSFAGTDPVVLEDWITDFRIRSSPGGLAEGFSTAAASVLPEVTALYKSSRESARHFSAHSAPGRWSPSSIAMPPPCCAPSVICVGTTPSVGFSTACRLLYATTYPTLI